jgi:hypothetical protein
VNSVALGVASSAVDSQYRPVEPPHHGRRSSSAEGRARKKETAPDNHIFVPASKPRLEPPSLFGTLSFGVVFFWSSPFSDFVFGLRFRTSFSGVAFGRSCEDHPRIPFWTASERRLLTGAFAAVLVLRRTGRQPSGVVVLWHCPTRPGRHLAQARPAAFESAGFGSAVPASAACASRRQQSASIARGRRHKKVSRLAVAGSLSPCSHHFSAPPVTGVSPRCFSERCTFR